MKTDIKVIGSGESVTEADIARWFKKDGDFVEMDEPLLELESDKASLEINSPVSGKLTILVGEGTTVEVGQVIGHVDDSVQAPAGGGAPAADAGSRESAESANAADPAADQASESTILNREMPSPAARKLMAEHNVSAQDVPGTGKDGRITKADVLNYVKELEKQGSVLEPDKKPTFSTDDGAPAPVISPDETVTFIRGAGGKLTQIGGESARSDRGESRSAGSDLPPLQHTAAAERGGERREKMSRLRRTISNRLVAAQQNAALLTTFNEVDMSAVMNIRKQYKEEFTKTHNVGLGFMSFFTKAAAQALKAYPIMNAQVDGDDVVYQDFYDVGIAVASPKGLVVPIVRDADRLSFWGVETAIAHLAQRARSGTLTPDDLTGGTFTITNGGVFGSMLSTPIVNAPQSAILGMHNIVERPVVKNGEVVVAPIMYLAVTYDHRIIDGADSVRFLVKIKQLLEDPTRLLLEL